MAHEEIQPHDRTSPQDASQTGTGVNLRRAGLTAILGPSGLIFDTGIALFRDLYNRHEFESDARAFLDLIRPVLLVMIIFGLRARQLRVNPPGGPTSFHVEFDWGRAPAVFPSDADAHQNRQPNLFDLPVLGMAPGLAIEFDRPDLPFYAARVLAEWKDPIVPPSGAPLPVFAHDDAGRSALIFNLGPIAAGVTTIPKLAEALAPYIEPFVRAVIARFRTEAETRANSSLYSIGLSGLIFDPDTWKHLFRWHESAHRRKVRIGAVRAIGLLVWRGLTGPDVSGQMSRLGNATDGPRKLETFLIEEIFGRQISVDGKSVMVVPPLIERLEVGIAQRAAENGLIEQVARSDWELRETNAKAHIRALHRALEADHKEIATFYDGIQNGDPPPDMVALQNGSVLSLIDQLIGRDFIRFECDSLLPPPGLAMDGIEARTPELIPTQFAIQMFVANWSINRPEARRQLLAIEMDFLMIAKSLILGSSVATAFDERTIRLELAAMRGSPLPPEYDALPTVRAGGMAARLRAIANNHSFQTTLSSTKPVLEARDHADAAASAARGLFAATGTVQENVLYDAWLKMGIGLTAADRFLYYGRWSKSPSRAMIRFCEGFGDGITANAGFEAGLKGELVALFRNQVDSLPVGFAFPPIFLGGLVVGMGEYLYNGAAQLADIIADPLKFVDAVTQALTTILSTEPQQLFYEMGFALGASALTEIRRLGAITNPVTYIYELGRLLGPLVLEEIISFLFEAYVFAPLVSAARGAVRRALIAPGRRWLDDLGTSLRGAGAVTDTAAEIALARNAMTNLGLDLDTFIDQVLATTGVFDDAPNGFRPTRASAGHTGGPEPHGAPHPGLDESEWIQKLYEQWRLQLDQLMSDSVLNAAVPKMAGSR